MVTLGELSVQGGAQPVTVYPDHQRGADVVLTLDVDSIYRQFYSNRLLFLAPV